MTEAAECSPPAQILRQLFRTAVAAADPAIILPPLLPQPPRGRTIVVGAGKAAAAMAQAVETHWPGPLSGLVATRHGQKLPTRQIEVLESAHPVPDAHGSRAAARMLEIVSGLTRDDLVICLISGGGSALLTHPAPGLTLEDLRAVTDQLLRSGAPIDEMNIVRKHLSAIAGGRLAATAHPARMVTLAISDVPGDDPTAIASGPTVADPSSFYDARTIVARHGLTLPPAVMRHLEGAEDETPKPGDARLEHASFIMAATPASALAAAGEAARGEGLRVLNLGDRIEGEAREVARAFAGIARSAQLSGLPVLAPAVILSGGETTVTLKGKGRGGRNSEFLLSLAVALGGAAGIHAIACDTDGIDGSEENAGAIIDPTTLSRAASLGLDARAFLADNDAYGFFEAVGDLIVTGPTHTNVNDFRSDY